MVMVGVPWTTTVAEMVGGYRPGKGKGYGGFRKGPPLPPGKGSDRENMYDLVHVIGNSMVNMNEQMANLAYALQNNQQSSGDSGFRAMKPKKELTPVTAETARVLITEQMNVETELGELGQSMRSEAAFRQLRALAQGEAKDVIDLHVEQGLGYQLRNQLEYLCQNNGTRDQKKLRRRAAVCIVYANVGTSRALDTAETARDR